MTTLNNTAATAQVAPAAQYTKAEARVLAIEAFTAVRTAVVQQGVHPVEVYEDQKHSQVVINLSHPVNGMDFIAIEPMFNSDFSFTEAEITENPNLIRDNTLFRCSAAGYGFTMELGDTELQNLFGEDNVERHYPRKEELKEKMEVAMTSIMMKKVMGLLRK